VTINARHIAIALALLSFDSAFAATPRTEAATLLASRSAPAGIEVVAPRDPAQFGTIYFSVPGGGAPGFGGPR
jgi:hypothetical protein